MNDLDLELCPNCRSHAVETDLIIEAGGGDDPDEEREFWRCHCYDCGHDWNVDYDWTIDPYADDFDEDV